MATTRFIDHLLEGDHASRPAAGDVPEGTLYSCTTHGLIYQSDTSTWTTWATLGGVTDLDTVLANSSGQDIADALTGAATPSAGNVFATMADVGGGGGSDPIADIFGTPDTAFEFDTSSLTGLTSMGTPDAEDADTTFPDQYFVRDNDSTMAGRYASVSAPFTSITKIADAVWTADYQYVGLFAGEATPGKLVTAGIKYASGQLAFVITQTSPSDGSPGTPSLNIVPGAPATVFRPWYVGIKAVSSTDISYHVSPNGINWYPILLNHNNSMTVASTGIAVAGFGGATARAAFDFLRIWNSAKTFPQWT